MEPIRIFIADDQVLVRVGIRAALTERADIHILGEAGSGSEVQEFCRKNHPDVVLLDQGIPGPPAHDTMVFLSHSCPEIKALLMVEVVDEETVADLLDQGARGYIRKDECFDDLERAIRVVQTGGFWLEPRMVQAWMRKVLQQLNAVEKINPRWVEILWFVHEGKTNRQIAEILSVSESTVRYHIGLMLEHLGARNRNEAVRMAFEKGWIHLKRENVKFPGER